MGEEEGERARRALPCTLPPAASLRKGQSKPLDRHHQLVRRARTNDVVKHHLSCTWTPRVSFWRRQDEGVEGKANSLCP